MLIRRSLRRRQAAGGLGIAFLLGAFFVTPLGAQSLDDAKRAAKSAIRAFSQTVKTQVKSQPRLLAMLEDKRIDESSGLVCGWRNPTLLWTHNDSGDGAYLYAIDRKGRTIAHCKVKGAENVDWEDIAIAPNAKGVPCLYIADTGDNKLSRDDTTIYRIEEPILDANRRDQTLKTERCEAFPFRYPDGLHDCETLMAHPKTGEIFLVTKEANGRSGVYAFPMPLRPDVRVTVNRVGEIRFKNSFLSGNSLMAQAERLATGGDISRDGTRLVVRTYTQALEWILPAGMSVPQALRTPPRAFMLPLTSQGESICYRPDGKALLTTSEKLPTPLFEIPLP